MFDFKKLFKLLERELNQQERLLGLLTKERAAIVVLNQEQLDQIREAKAVIIDEMIDIESRRKAIFDKLAETAKKEEPLKFVDVLELCPPAEGRGQLKHIGDNLKRVAMSVKELNDQNSALIKQSLGLIASTISIIRSAPESDLPTYTHSGELTTTTEDPAFSAKSQLSREA